MDFVLKDPREKEEKAVVSLPHRQEMAVLPKPWHSSYVAGIDFAGEHLHAINNCMLQLLKLWQVSFRFVLLGIYSAILTLMFME